jgi:uncharacterized protein (DUF1499 family)
MLRRLGRGLVAALALAVIAAYAVINLAEDDPARWHVDPATMALRRTPNEFLAAPPGTTVASPHMATAIRPGTPQQLLACFDAIARSQPRVTVLAGDLDSLMITYVQRSRFIGFPDYITVKAVPGEPGTSGGRAGLIVYSRSRYGYGDFGVNEARVTSWLAKARQVC